MILIASGSAGVGKNEILKRLLLRDHQFRVPRSWTTRSLRADDFGGIKNYRFVDHETFMDKVAANGFAEWKEVHGGNLYGTPIEELNDQSARDTLLEIDCEGAIDIKRMNGEVVAVFFLPPSYSVLEGRLRKRATDSEDSIQTRLQTSTKEIARVAKFDYWIENDDLDVAVADLQELIATLRNGRVPRYKFTNYELLSRVRSTFPLSATTA